MTTERIATPRSPRGAEPSSFGTMRGQRDDPSAGELKRARRSIVAAMFPRDEGTAVDLRYTLGPAIGAGGLGRVYRAHDRRLGRDVAMKFLRGSNVVTSTLEREARVLARLQHPNIVSVFDVGTSEGEFYLTMELVDGESLAEKLRGPAAEWADVVRLFRQAARGLWAAHQAGVVHRDFKPANVMVGHDDRVRVVDFGLARELGAVTDTTTVPGGAVVTRAAGTRQYMAPEQFAGEVTPESDQFAFCTSMYEALVGDRPWADSERGVASPADAGRLQSELRTAGTPRWLQAVLVKGLQRDPTRRFADMARLLLALNPPRRHWRWAAGIFASTAVIAGLVAQTDDCDIRGSAPQAWTSQRRRAFADIAGADVGAGVASLLEAYVDAWNKDDTATCRGREDGSISAALHDLRGQCMRRSRARVDALVEYLDDPSPSVSSNAVAATKAATLIAECSDDEGLLLGQPEAEHDPAEADRLRAAVDRAHVSLSLGKQQESFEILRRAQAQIDNPGAAPRDELWLAAHLGHAYVRRGDVAKAEAFVRPAMLRAEQHPRWAREAGDLRTVLAQAVVGKAGRAGEALVLGQQAVAILSTLSDDGRFEVAAHGVVAQAAIRTGRPDDALAATSRGLEVVRRAEADETLAWFDLALNHAQLEGVRADVLASTGRIDEAADAYERALGVLREQSLEIGLTAEILNNLAMLRPKGGRPDDAIALLERATEIKLDLGEAESAALTLMNIGNVHAASQHAEMAIAAYDRALAVAPKNAEGSRSDVLFARGLVWLSRGRPHDAQSDQVEARMLAQRVRGDDDPSVYPIDIALGQVLVELHQFKRARLILQHGRTLETPQTSHYSRAELRVALSRAWAEEDRALARSLATAAVVDATASGAETLIADAASQLARVSGQD